jgi:hypothetical protein
MDYSSFVQSLMEARRRAQLQGRPMSAEEAAAATGPVIREQGERELQGQALNIDFDKLAQDRWITQQKIKKIQSESTNDLINRFLETGEGLLKYKTGV